MTRSIAAPVWALVAVLVVQGDGGCGEEDAPEGHAIRLDEIHGADAAAGTLPRARVQEMLATTLAASPSLRLAGPDESGLAAAARYEIGVDHAGRQFLLLSIGIEAPPGLRSTYPEGLGVPVSFEPADGVVEPARDLPRAAARAAAVVEAQIALGSRGRPAALELLGADDPQLVVLALMWIRDHPSRDVADAVAGLLEHEDDHVALMAVECLGLVGTEDHAAALVRSLRLGDRAHAHRGYEALASLGGPHARGFLEFAARNEDDPSLAAAARRALDTVRSGATGQTGRPVSRGHRR